MRAAVSLVEVLLALGLFAGALLAVLGVFPALGQAVAHGRNMALATTLAERVLEEARAQTAGATGSLVVERANTFYYTLTIRPQGSLRDLQVEIVWYEGAGTLHRVRLETEVLP